MKRILTVALVVAWCVVAGMAQGNVALAERASQFYSRGEWASSCAAYTTLAREQPKMTEYWVRGIVSALLKGDGQLAREEMLNSVDNHVPIDSVFDGIFNETIAQGKCDMYEHFLLDMKNTERWMGRVINRCLLKYYVFRDDAEKIVSTANVLLATTPDNMLFLPSLAYGQLLSGDMEGMAATNRHILELDSSNVEALLYLANYYYSQWKQGNAEAKDAALKYVSQVERISKTPQIERMLAELMR